MGVAWAVLAIAIKIFQLIGLVMARNLSACDPPLPESEVRAIVRSINNYRATENIPLTDHGNALRFVALHGQDLLYVEPGGFWLHWCGAHWRTIHRKAVLKLVYGVPGAILIEAAACGDDIKANTALRKHAIATQARSKLEATFELAGPLLLIDGEHAPASPCTGPPHPVHRDTGHSPTFLGVVVGRSLLVDQ